MIRLNIVQLSICLILSTNSFSQVEQSAMVVQAYEPFSLVKKNDTWTVFKDNLRYSANFDTMRYVNQEIMVFYNGWKYFEAYGKEYALLDTPAIYRVCEEMPKIDACHFEDNLESIRCIHNVFLEELESHQIISKEEWEEIQTIPYVLKVEVGKDNQIKSVTPFASMENVEREAAILEFVKNYDGWISAKQLGNPVNVEYILALKAK